MTHDEARLLIGAAPGESSESLAAHLARCPHCARFQQQMRRMERDLARVLATPPPPLPAGRRTGEAPRRRGPTLLALAASLTLGAVLGALFWALRPPPSLAAGIIRHLQWESGSWSAVAPMTAAATAQVLDGAGVSLDQADMTVTFARVCLFDGHWVPHLVVRTATGPVTVMVLRREHVAGRQSFRRNGYSGTLLPMPGGGTLAVVAPGAANMDAVERSLDPHLHWTP
jgi:hypothetical protein